MSTWLEEHTHTVVTLCMNGEVIRMGFSNGDHAKTYWEMKKAEEYTIVSLLFEHDTKEFDAGYGEIKALNIMNGRDINLKDLPYIVTYHPLDGKPWQLMASFLVERDARAMIAEELPANHKLWIRLEDDNYIELKT